MKQLMHLAGFYRSFFFKSQYTVSFSICLTILVLGTFNSAQAASSGSEKFENFLITPGGKPSGKAANLAAQAKKSRHPCVRMSPERLLVRAKPYMKAIRKHAGQYEVEPALIKAVIAVESCYQKKARSPKAAQGLMQLIPATAERFGVEDAYNSSQNIHGGTQYLRWLSKRYAGDLVKVLAAYNAGEGRVDRYKGVPPFKETRLYVKNVLLVYQRLKNKLDGTTESIEIPTHNSAARTFASVLGALPVIKYPVQRKQKSQTVVQKKAATQNKALAQKFEALPDGFIRGGPAQPLPEVRRAAALALKVQQAKAKPAAVTASRTPKVKAQQAKAKPSLPQVQVRKAILRPTNVASQPGKKPVAARKAVSRASAPAASVQKRRVVHQYSPPPPVIKPSKPGRGGWRVNKSRAPHLFKQ